MYFKKEGSNMGYNDDIKMLIDAQDLTLPPPEREPQRQYYFIKKCREIVKKKSEELGRPLYACSVCMGCPSITFVNDPLNLLINGRRHALPITSRRMCKVPSNKYFITVIVIINQTNGFGHTKLCDH